MNVQVKENQGKGVQFDITDSISEKNDIRNRSTSTEPLQTDSYSGESEREIFENNSDGNGEVIHLHVRGSNKEIQEQWGYNPRAYNRIKLRQEYELEEFNFGIDFSKLKDSKEQQSRLRKYLHQKSKALNNYIDAGTGPVFGYPPICYSPPNELKKSEGKREYMTVLMRHVFQRPESLASVTDIIDAKEAEDNYLKEVMK